MQGRAAGGAATGLGLAILSAAAFGTSGTFATGLLDAGWSPGAAVTARVVIAALVLTVPALIVIRRQRVSLRGAGRGVTIYGLVAVAGCQLCYFNAVQHISVAAALLIEYSGVLFVVLWVWLRDGQRPRRLTGYGALAAVAGLVLVLDLVNDFDVDPIGLLWAFGAAAGLAVYYVVSAKAADGVPPLVVAWSGMSVGALALLALGAVGAWPITAPRVDVTLVHTRMSWLVPVLGLALVATVIAYVSGIAAARRLGAKAASFTGLLEVLFAVTFAWVALSQALDAWQLGGAALVVVGVTLVQLDERRSPTAGVERPQARVRRGGPLIVRACLALRPRRRPVPLPLEPTPVLTPDPLPPVTIEPKEPVTAGR